MVSCIPVDLCQASVSTKYNTNIQVQKKYKVHNNNHVNPSAKITQTMCVIPYIVQTNCKYCLRKQAMTVASIIG